MILIISTVYMYLNRKKQHHNWFHMNSSDSYSHYYLFIYFFYKLMANIE